MEQKTTTLSGRAIDEWTFRNADTQYLTHGLHPYPARMIPQLAHKLINKYSERNSWILDPFCGSGTVLVEARLRDRNSIGNEINPLAILLSKVKTTPLEKKELKRISNQLLDDLQLKTRHLQSKHCSDRVESIEKWIAENRQTKEENFAHQAFMNPPVFPNIDLWFKPEVINELGIIRSVVMNLDCKQEYTDFTRVCLSYTAMKASNADFEKHQSHPSRYKPEKLKTYSPDAIAIFCEKLNDSVRRIIAFSDKTSNKSSSCHVLSGDARTLNLKGIAPADGVDLIVTSPPYGEEQNTIGYHRWSRIMAFWVGFSKVQMKESESLTLGARSCKETFVHSKTANYFIDMVGMKRKRDRAIRLASFFQDYQMTIERMASWLKTEGIIAIVVGNRLAAGHRIPMDKVTVELAEEYGLRELDIFHREIPNTVMPKRIPEGETIAKESIIVLQKM